jgi:hypothetical protein
MSLTKQDQQQTALRAARQEKNGTAQQPRAKHRAIERTSPPGQAPEERRLQGETAQSAQSHSETDPNIVRAKDGSNTALQFKRKQMRRIHIDPHSGHIEPVSEWEPVNLPKILQWVNNTTPSNPQHTGAFIRLGAAL